MRDILIRHSKSTDVDAITKIYEGREAYSGTLQLPFPSGATWEKRIGTVPQGSHSLVAELDGEVVGQIGVDAMQNPRRKHVASIGMAVKDTHGGKGIGTKLMASAIDLADNWLNIRRVELTVYVDNDKAVALYKKFGFAIEGESIDYAFRNGRYVNVYHMARLHKAAHGAV
ncbi:MAG: GNAT family N-acetyltransferase [Janthinobacterium lividum]